MADTLMQVPLTGREGEALMFALTYVVDVPDREPEDRNDPLASLLAEGFTREQIMPCGPRLYDFCFKDYIEEPLSDVEKAILRVCVENTTFLQPFIDLEPTGLAGAKQTLRDLAAKLELFGIEVNHIPND